MVLHFLSFGGRFFGNRCRRLFSAAVFGGRSPTPGCNAALPKPLRPKKRSALQSRA
jgi:hypothetical protein